MSRSSSATSLLTPRRSPALLLLLAAVVALAGAALLGDGVRAANAERRREGELPRPPEDRVPPRPGP